MRNMEQKNSENRVLTDAELDAINGGNWFGDALRAVGHFIVGALHGPGDHRRPLDSPK